MGCRRLCLRNLVDIDAELAQVNLGLVNLSHELLVRVGNVVEGQDAPAETEEGDSAEGNEGPEGELDTALVRCLFVDCRAVFRFCGVGQGTYDRDDLLLDQRRKRDEFEEEDQVELFGFTLAQDTREFAW